ncbi:hypothetical protein ACFXTN_039020 [Malus domestica]
MYDAFSWHPGESFQFNASTKIGNASFTLLIAFRPSGTDTTLLRIARILSLTSMSPSEFKKNGIKSVSNMNEILDGKIDRLYSALKASCLAWQLLALSEFLRV